MTTLPKGPGQARRLSMTPARHTAWRLWGWPVSLGLLSASGLASALVSDSWGDAWSWLALGLPVLVIVRCPMRR
ncbi:hypothetical protein ACG04Q_24530 [Roseateles sp. DXS20W]|uniref:DUF58 domain-containing protein n=1 Tax=Pelomonas lactea TaxID=3299030 RepID=A0ABW7GS17_9BURK